MTCLTSFANPLLDVCILMSEKFKFAKETAKVKRLKSLTNQFSLSSCALRLRTTVGMTTHMKKNTQNAPRAITISSVISYLLILKIYPLLPAITDSRG